MAEQSDDDLLAELGVEAEAGAETGASAGHERLVSGFDEIVNFRRRHGRSPEPGEGRDIFERLYAARLLRLRSLPDAVELLVSRDSFGLLAPRGAGPPGESETVDDDALLAELGLDPVSGETDITSLRHVRPSAERHAAEEVAARTPCREFRKFRPMFEKVNAELRSGVRKTKQLDRRSVEAIQAESFFIVGGQLAYIAAIKDSFTTTYDREDRRLRVIYDNGTESDLLLRSFQRALHRDEVPRLVMEPGAGPLFGATVDDEDVASGTIYVLRSLSDDPFIAAHREVVHKIGVTTESVQTRIASANRQPTYLLADVEVVVEYSVANINATKLEKLLHRVFASAQINARIVDRFGQPVQPREWFLVPLPAIDEAVSRVRDGSITNFEYSPQEGRLLALRGTDG